MDYSDVFEPVRVGFAAVIITVIVIGALWIVVGAVRTGVELLLELIGGIDDDDPHAEGYYEENADGSWTEYDSDGRRVD